MSRIKFTLPTLFAVALLLLASCGVHLFAEEENAGTTKYAYCVFVEQETCSAGSFELCDAGGMLSNSCPYNAISQNSSSSTERGRSSSVYTIQGDKGNNISNYKTVTIGKQTWMAENLNYKTENSLCYGENGRIYDSDEQNYETYERNYYTLTPEEVQANCNKYGRLYDWATAMDFEPSCNRGSLCANRVATKNHKGICPENWHIPTQAEYDTLVSYVEIDQFCGAYKCGGLILKAKSGWKKNEIFDGNGHDDYGFAALPGGIIDLGDDTFFTLGNRGYWWSTTGIGLALLETRDLADLGKKEDSGSKTKLVSIRCIKDFVEETYTPNNLPGYSATEGEGGNSSYSAVVGKGNNINNYKTVKIGEQTWMAENLDYPVEGSMCYNNMPQNCEKYGRLYSGWAAMNVPSNCFFGNCDSQMQLRHQGVCPNGWHIPKDWEWDILIAFVHSDNNLPAFYYGKSPYAGKYLKAKSGWRDYPGIAGEDKYEFAALPGGGEGVHINTAGGSGTWWSATEYHHGNSPSRSMYDDEDSVDWYFSNGYENNFYSVRCLKD